MAQKATFSTISQICLPVRPDFFMKLQVEKLSLEGRYEESMSISIPKWLRWCWSPPTHASLSCFYGTRNCAIEMGIEIDRNLDVLLLSGPKRVLHNS